MAVKITFNHDNTVEKPTFVLAMRSCSKIGIINTTNEHFSRPMNSVSEISFSVNKNDVSEDVWRELTNFKFVWCKEYDLWFEIYVELSDGDETTKNVTGKTVCEAELSQTNLYNITINTDEDLEDGIGSPLYNSSNHSKSIIHRILEKVQQYKIGHIDERIDGEDSSKLQRTFSFNDISIYDAIIEVCSEIKAIAVFGNGSDADGIVERTVNIYDIEKYGEDTNVFVSKENLAENITLSADVDSVKNCMRLEAGDDLMTDTVRNVNPNGSNYLWNIPEYMKNDMSDGLRSKLTQYSAYYDSIMKSSISTSFITSKDEYNSLINKYKTLYKKIKNGESITEIGSSVNGYPQLSTLLYKAIDFSLFLQTEMMPEVKMPTASDANKAYDALIEYLLDEFSDIGVSKKSSISANSFSIVTNAVESLARAFVDKRYDADVTGSTLNIDGSVYTWKGKITLKNKNDDEDEYTSDFVEFGVTDNIEDYLKQKMDKMIAASEDVDDITSLLSSKKNISDFKNEIKWYSVDNLNIIYNAAEGALNVLIQNGISSESSKKSSSNNDVYTELYKPLHDKMDAVSDEIKVRNSEIKTIEKVKKQTEKKRKSIQKNLSIENSLSGYLNEFLSFRRETTYSNSNYISDGLTNYQLVKHAQEFLDRAEEEINKSLNDQYRMSADIKNLLVMKEFEIIKDKFDVGNWIRINIDGTIYKLRLIKYDIDYEDMQNLQVEFADVSTVKSKTSSIKDILDQARSISTSYNATAYQAKKGSKSNATLDDMMQHGINADEYTVFNSSTEEGIKWNKNGFIVRDYDQHTKSYSPFQLKILNNGVYLTDDNWKTNKVGIGMFSYVDENNQNKEKFGISADVVYGSLLLGEQLQLNNKSGTMEFNDSGLSVKSKESYKIGDTSFKDYVRISPSSSDSLFSIYSKDTDTDSNFVKKIMSVDKGNILIKNWEIKDDNINGATSYYAGLQSFINIHPEHIVMNYGKQIYGNYTIEGMHVDYNPYDDDVLNPELQHMCSLGIGNGYYGELKLYYIDTDDDNSSSENTVTISGGNGSVSCKSINTRTITASSNVSVKKNVTCLNVYNTLDNDDITNKNNLTFSSSKNIIDALTPIEYKWEDDEEYDGNVHYGFDTDYIKSFFNEHNINNAIIKTDSNGKDSIAFSELHAVEISAIKDIINRLNDIEDRIDNFEQNQNP